MSWIRIDVDLDNIYNEMDRGDKRTIAEWLYEDGILQSHPNPEIRKLVRGDDESLGEYEFRNDLTKLWNGHYQLTIEDQEFIKTIANKL
jgi:hypothetical protein